MSGIDRATALRAVKLAGAFLLPLLVVAGFFSYDVQAAIARLQRDTPEARVEDLMKALVQGDQRAAFAAWRVPDRGHGPTLDALAQRRSEVVRAILEQRPQRYTVEAVEWWSMCCEPHIISSREWASGARYTIVVDGVRYRVDAFATNKAAVYERLPATGWVVYDMYPAGGKPLYNTFPGR